MFNRAQGVVPAPVRAEPTSLLTLVAGEFALRVARLWPAPHAEFLTAPAPRRHLICIAFTLGRDVPALADTVLSKRSTMAIAAATGGAPAGLARAIGRMGDLAWSAQTYRELLTLLAQPKACKALRHATQIEPAMVEQLAALPGPLAGSVELATKLDRAQVELLREAYAALAFQGGEARAEAAAMGWTRFDTPKALFAAVRSDVCPEPAAPPFAATGRLRPLTAKADFAEAARRYRNCLADQTPYAASGWSAYYEWTGAPGAMVEISRDHVFGWRLEQARTAGNAPVPEALREEIISELALLGVHVGRSGWELDRALSGFEGPWRPRPTDQAIAEVFGAE